MVQFEESIKKHKFSWLKQIVTLVAEPTGLFCNTPKIAYHSETTERQLTMLF